MLSVVVRVSFTSYYLSVFLLCKLVPVHLATANGMTPGDCVFIHDCHGRAFSIFLENIEGLFFLGRGWKDLLASLGCLEGDVLFFTPSRDRTYRVWVIVRSCDGAAISKNTSSTHVATGESLFYNF